MTFLLPLKSNAIAIPFIGKNTNDYGKSEQVLLHTAVVKLASNAL